MLSTFAEAGRVLNNNQYLDIAARNANFLLTALRPQGRLHRAWRQGQVSPEVFLEDYASLMLGLLELYQSDFNNRWFAEAYGLAAEMVNRFSDPTGGFFTTPADAETLLTRPRDLQDNAVPSGNALAVEALLKLAAYTGKEDWRRMAGQAVRYPTAFGRWLSAADFSLGDVKQVAIIGPLENNLTKAFLAEIRAAFRPNLVVAQAIFPSPDGVPALLVDRPMLDGKPTTYVCQGFICRLPVNKLDDIRKQL
jgi:uncharacterized protein YyaL (SSP411 family)